MLKVFLSALAAFRHHWNRLPSTKSQMADQERWRSDPLAHPDIAAMSQQQLADLPFEPRRVCPG